MRVYLGVDPGIKTIGLAAVDEQGIGIFVDAINDNTKVKTKLLDPARLYAMVCRAIESIVDAELGTDVDIALEIPFIGQFRTAAGHPTTNQNALKTYGVFAALAVTFEHRVESQDARMLRIVHPQQLKSFLGAKSKLDVARAVQERWDFRSESRDITDAFALAQYARSQDS